MDKTTTISDESEETGDEVYHVKLNRVRACETRKNKSPTLGATVCGTYVKHIVDTGSQTNVMSSTTCNSLKQKPKLKVTNARLYPLNSKEPLDTLGEFDASLVINNITKVVKYIVVNSEHRKLENLLGYETLCDFGIVNAVNSIQNSEYTNYIKKKFATLFRDEVGHLDHGKTKVHIDVDPTAKPVQQPGYDIPQALYDCSK